MISLISLPYVLQNTRFSRIRLTRAKKYEAKATFFITGNSLGKGMINDPEYPWATVIQVYALLLKDIGMEANKM